MIVDLRLIEALGRVRGRAPRPADGSTRRFSRRSPPPATTALRAARPSASATPLADWHAGREIEVDLAGARARIERGAAVDLGGIGKGFAATRALARDARGVAGR